MIFFIKLIWSWVILGCIFIYILDFSNVTQSFKIRLQEKNKNVTENGEIWKRIQDWRKYLEISGSWVMTILVDNKHNVIY